MKTSLSIRYAFRSLPLLTPSAKAADSRWAKQQSGVRANLTDIVMLDSLTAIVAGENGTIFRTSYAGQTWVVIDSGGAISWKVVAFADSRNGVVVGDHMASASTTDGGPTWLYSVFERKYRLMAGSCV